MRLTMCVLMAVMGISMSLSVHAADAAAGKSAYSVCSTCHSPNGGGNQSLNAPRIAGQFDWYLKRQIDGIQRRNSRRDAGRHLRRADAADGDDARE